MNDRRRHARREVDLEATYQMEGKPPVETRITDMSPGGAFVELTERITFGVELTLEIQFPKTKAITVKSVVRWTKPGGAGVQFGALGARETYTITEFLAAAPIIVSVVPLPG